MSASFTRTAFDFAGFLDGFQARNLDSIQRDIDIHLSEIQARLTVIRGQLIQSGGTAAAAADKFIAIEREFQKRNASILDQMSSGGKLITQALIEDAETFARLPALDDQLKGLLRAFLMAAEVSRNESLIKQGIGLAETYQSTIKNPAVVRAVG
jgi:hypothetical protein